MFILFFGPLWLQAQSDSLYRKKDSLRMKHEHELKNTISVNVSSFLEKTFKTGFKPDLNTPFLLYARNFNKFSLRLGVNGLNSKNTETNVQTNEQTVTNHFYTSASLGFYRNKNISRAFSVSYGVNLLYAYVDSSSAFITAFDMVTSYAKSMHYGVAPGVLVKYRFSKRLSVFAEYTLPLKVIYSKTGTEYSLFPEENTTDRKTTNYSAQIYNPISIYLSCSF
jgi:hypothetical protein